MVVCSLLIGPHRRFLEVTRGPHQTNWHVLRVLYEATVTLGQSKLKFLPDTIDYLGHGIRPGLLEVAEHSTDAVVKLNNFTTQTKLRSIVVFYNVFKEIVPNFCQPCKPFNKKLRKYEPEKLVL